VTLDSRANSGARVGRASGPRQAGGPALHRYPPGQERPVASSPILSARPISWFTDSDSARKRCSVAIQQEITFNPDDLGGL